MTQLAPPVEQSDTLKIVNLCVALLRQPKYISPWLRQSARLGTPMDLEVPFFSYAAIDYLRSVLTTDMTVVEYGGGGSTLFFARRVRRVITIEHDDNWVADISRRLESAQLRNVELIHATADFSSPTAFGTSAFALAVPSDTQADVVAVDSYDYFQGHPFRPILFERAKSIVKPGGFVILDDSHRYTRLRHDSGARDVRIFAGVGPARRPATCTDIYRF